MHRRMPPSADSQNRIVHGLRTNLNRRYGKSMQDFQPVFPNGIRSRGKPDTIYDSILDKLGGDIQKPDYFTVINTQKISAEKSDLHGFSVWRQIFEI
jgi:hypothetical protein